MRHVLLKSTRKVLFPIKYSLKSKGFSIVEAVFAISILGLLITTFAGILIYGQESTSLAGARARATFLAEEGLEVVRNIRDANFSNLIDGEYGISISNNQWQFSGNSDQTGAFNRQISINSINSNTKQITSSVNWQQTPQRTGDVVLTTYLTNWKAAVQFEQQADYLTVDLGRAYASNKKIGGILLGNSGISDITIDRIVVSWTSSVSEIEEVDIGGMTREWSKNGPGSPIGNQLSGSELDVENYTLTSGRSGVELDFRFSENMAGETLDIIIIMTDGSQKTINGITVQ